MSERGSNIKGKYSIWWGKAEVENGVRVPVGLVVGRTMLVWNVCGVGVPRAQQDVRFAKEWVLSRGNEGGVLFSRGVQV